MKRGSGEIFWLIGIFFAILIVFELMIGNHSASFNYHDHFIVLSPLKLIIGFFLAVVFFTYLVRSVLVRFLDVYINAILIISGLLAVGVMVLYLQG